MSKNRNLLCLHIGNKLRTLRAQLGITQRELGDVLGVTFQQIQKYEKGMNKIAADTLHYIAMYCNVEISYFFEGANHLLRSGQIIISDQPAAGYIQKTNADEIRIILMNFALVRNKEVRQLIIDFIKQHALAEGVSRNNVNYTNE